MDDTPDPCPILDFLVGLESPPLFVAILVGIPSGLLYLAQVLLVLTNWAEFNSSFFKLFLVRAIPSLWNLFSSYWSFRLPMLFPVPLLPLYLRMPRLLLLSFFFSSYFTFHVENLSTFFLILNRFTSILAPFRHQKMWKWGVPLAVGLIFLLPLPFNYGIFGLRGQIIFLDDQNVSFSFVTPAEEFPYSRAASVSSVIFILFCTFLNIATVVVYRRHKFLVGSLQQPQADQSMEARLTKYAAITFFCQLFMGFCFLSLFVTQAIASPRSYQVGYAIFNFYGLINDIFTITIPAWSMLWSSSKMRHLFAQKFPFLDHSSARPFRTIARVNATVSPKAKPSTSIRMNTIKVRNGSRTKSLNTQKLTF